MVSQLQLSIAAPGVTDDEITRIARDLTKFIGNAAPECQFILQTQAGPEENKGILEIFGTLGVALLQPGALKALIECLAVFIKERRPEVCITLQLSSGGSVTLKAGGVGPEQLDKLLERLREMLGSTPAGHC